MLDTNRFHRTSEHPPFLLDLDPPVGCGIISGDPAPKAISYLSAVGLTVVRPPLLYSPCVVSFLRRPHAEVIALFSPTFFSVHSLLQNSRLLQTQDASLANPKVLIISQQTRKNFRAGFSILVIWAPKIRVKRRDNVQSNFRKQLEGGCYPCRKRLRFNLSCGSYHIDLNMDTVVTAVCQLFSFVTGARPEFRSQGGSNAENLALQNIQV